MQTLFNSGSRLVEIALVYGGSVYTGDCSTERSCNVGLKLFCVVGLCQGDVFMSPFCFLICYQETIGINQFKLLLLIGQLIMQILLEFRSLIVLD